MPQVTERVFFIKSYSRSSQYQKRIKVSKSYKNLVSVVAKHDKGVFPLNHTLIKGHVVNGCWPGSPNTSCNVKHFWLAISDVNFVFVEKSYNDRKKWYFGFKCFQIYPFNLLFACLFWKTCFFLFFKICWYFNQKTERVIFCKKPLTILTIALITNSKMPTPRWFISDLVKRSQMWGKQTWCSIMKVFHSSVRCPRVCGCIILWTSPVIIPCTEGYFSIDHAKDWSKVGVWNIA